MASVDTPEKNKQFAEQEQANFPMLSDPDRGWRQAYGVVSSPTGVAKRWTFYIGADGKILHRQDGEDRTAGATWPPSRGAARQAEMTGPLCSLSRLGLLDAAAKGGIDPGRVPRDGRLYRIVRWRAWSWFSMPTIAGSRSSPTSAGSPKARHSRRAPGQLSASTGPAIGRQVRIDGETTRVTDEEADSISRRGRAESAACVGVAAERDAQGPRRSRPRRRGGRITICRPDGAATAVLVRVPARPIEDRILGGASGGACIIASCRARRHRLENEGAVSVKPVDEETAPLRPKRLP